MLLPLPVIFIREAQEVLVTMHNRARQTVQGGLRQHSRRQKPIPVRQFLRAADRIVERGEYWLYAPLDFLSGRHHANRILRTCIRGCVDDRKVCLRLTPERQWLLTLACFCWPSHS